MSKDFNWFQTAGRRVMSAVLVVVATALLLSLVGCEIDTHKDEANGKKDVEIRTPFGDMNVKNRADAKDTGLPVYPKATLKPSSKDDDDEGKGQAQVSLSMFGMKIAVVSYLSDDPPDKVVAWYRNELKPMGTFVECTGKSNDIGSVNMHENKDDTLDKPVTCDHNDAGGSREVTQLKMGTEGNQRVVAIGTRKDGKPGTEFALVRVIIGKHGGETL